MADHSTNSSPKAFEAPQAEIVNGVKVFPTSYIPARAQLRLPKKMMVELQEWHIEGIHIVIFLLLTVGLFITKWNKPDLR